MRFHEEGRAVAESGQAGHSNPAAMDGIAFVTVSKGRLQHIKKTLPLLLRQGATEVAVVDYDCPDGTADWVEAHFPTVKIVRATDNQGFCLSRGRNLGAEQTRSEWLVFVDADVETEEGWMEWMEQHLKPGHFYRAEPVGGQRDPNTYGTVICARGDFEAVSGYDEAHRGWGGEDEDLYYNLIRHGVVEDHYPSKFVRAIPHGNEMRAGWQELGGMNEMFLVNHIYHAAKRQLEVLLDQRAILPLEVRCNIMADTRRMMADWLKDSGRDATGFKYVFRSGFQGTPPYVMRMEMAFTIYVSRSGVHDTLS
jgi:glycosyltransferase involved in cell wall biosynthesis